MAHLGFVVYDKLGRWYHLDFRSGVANFFYKGPDSRNFRFCRPHGISVESSFSLFLQPSKNLKFILIWREVLKKIVQGSQIWPVVMACQPLF